MDLPPKSSALVAMGPLRALVSLILHLSRRRKLQLALTLALITAGAAAEIATILTALNFFHTLTHSGKSGFTDTLISGPLLSESRATVAALALVVAACLMVAVRTLLQWVGNRMIMAIGEDLTNTMFSRTLRLPYAVHLARNSSESMGAMERLQRFIISGLGPALQGVSAAVIAIGIISILFFINFVGAVVIASVTTLIYGATALAAARKLQSNSRELAGGMTDRMRVLQEALGSIRDLVLSRSQKLFEGRFSKIEHHHRRLMAQSSFIAVVPRLMLEGAGIVSLALIALVVAIETGSGGEAVAVAGSLAVGAQRLLPLVQQVWQGWSQLASQNALLLETVALLETEVRDDPVAVEPLVFRTDLACKGVTFAHGESATLTYVNLRIDKGDCVGFTGKTGAGKSTLLDLLMGLLAPTGGMIAIDGEPLMGDRRTRWQATLGHVPQAIYLLDDTIEANIIFGSCRTEFDRQAVEASVRAAQLGELIADLPMGLESRIGEGGVRLSGGQRQRIGLARALFRRPQVLFLDEATSALDEETEAAILDELCRTPDLTLIIASHRHSTLKRCSKHFHIADGRVTELDHPNVSSAAIAEG